MHYVGYESCYTLSASFSDEETDTQAWLASLNFVTGGTLLKAGVSDFRACPGAAPWSYTLVFKGKKKWVAGEDGLYSPKWMPK